jgi:CheY-like chemotaxis protein
MNSKPLRYIVIDDDPHNNLSCTIAIKAAISTASVHCFTVPEEGLDYIETEYARTRQAIPTVLFLDINMPSMTGWEVLERFKDFAVPIKEQITIYILSSSVSPIDQELAHANPFVADYIIKPLTKSKVFQIIEKSEARKIA